MTNWPALPGGNVILLGHRSVGKTPGVLESCHYITYG